MSRSVSTELCSCIRDERDGLDRRVHAGGEDYIHGETLNPPAWTDACCLDLSAVRSSHVLVFHNLDFFLGGGLSDTSSSSSSAFTLMYNMPDILLSQSPAFAPCREQIAVHVDIDSPIRPRESAQL